MGYKQCNGDHTVFYRHSRCQILVLAVYVDDIIITGDDEREIIQLKENLSKEFEAKDLGQLRYFLGIEIARNPKRYCSFIKKVCCGLVKSDMHAWMSTNINTD
jgi:hypothetical protein